MTCDDIRNALGEYHDRELDSAKADVVRSHLASCSACSAELRSLESLDRALRASPARPASVSWDAYLDKVRDRAGLRRRPSWRAILPFAAAALLAVGFSRWFQAEDRRPLLDRYASAGPEEQSRLEHRVMTAGPKELSPLIAAMIADPDPARRDLAIRLLTPRLRGQDETVRRLLLDRSDELARGDADEEILIGVGFEPGDEDLVAPALEMARSSANYADAIRILRRLDQGALNRKAHGEIVRRLREMLSSDLPRDRELAVRVAGELEILVEDVVEFLEVPDLGGRVLEFLKRQTGQDFGKDKNAWRAWFARQTGRM
jgi:hypothetical protein